MMNTIEQKQNKPTKVNKDNKNKNKNDLSLNTILDPPEYYREKHGLFMDEEYMIIGYTKQYYKVIALEVDDDLMEVYPTESIKMYKAHITKFSFVSTHSKYFETVKDGKVKKYYKVPMYKPHKDKIYEFTQEDEGNEYIDNLQEYFKAKREKQ